MAASVKRILTISQGSERTCKPYDPIEVMNNAEDEPTVIDCPKCKNKGVIYFSDGIYEMCRDCECMVARRSLKRIERSGLKEALGKCTFENFKTDDKFQKEMKTKAWNFTKDFKNKWFFIGGQVGCGKTHICTAIVRKFLVGENMNTRYFQWRDEVPKIKSKANTEEYPEILKIWKNVKVLYIDDLFKTEQGKNPTTADVNIAFEILNYRYQNPDLITIISSEKRMTELIDIDEAVASRIAEKSAGYCINVYKDIKKNYRLKNMF